MTPPPVSVHLLRLALLAELIDLHFEDPDLQRYADDYFEFLRTADEAIAKEVPKEGSDSLMEILRYVSVGGGQLAADALETIAPYTAYAVSVVQGLSNLDDALRDTSTPANQVFQAIQIGEALLGATLNGDAGHLAYVARPERGESAGSALVDVVSKAEAHVVALLESDLSCAPALLGTFRINRGLRNHAVIDKGLKELGRLLEDATIAQYVDEELESLGIEVYKKAERKPTLVVAEEALTDPDTFLASYGPTHRIVVLDMYDGTDLQGPPMTVHLIPVRPDQTDRVISDVQKALEYGWWATLADDVSGALVFTDSVFRDMVVPFQNDVRLMDFWSKCGSLRLSAVDADPDLLLRKLEPWIAGLNSDRSIDGPEAPFL